MLSDFVIGLWRVKFTRPGKIYFRGYRKVCTWFMKEPQGQHWDTAVKFPGKRNGTGSVPNTLTNVQIGNAKPERRPTARANGRRAGNGGRKRISNRRTCTERIQ